MVSTAAAMAFCLLGTLGNGDPLVYPLGRVSTHPLRMLGLTALGSNLGEFSVCKYHGRTAMWWAAG